MEQTKIVKLIPEMPYSNNMEIDICDFGGPGGKLRTRGKITADYSPYDMKQLKNEGCDTLEKALEYYREKIYQTVRQYLLTDFQLDGEWDEVLDPIREKIKVYYESV